MEPGKARPKRHHLSQRSSSLMRLKSFRGSSSEVLFAPSQSLCESTAFAEKCSAGCCFLPEPSFVVGETRIQRKPLCLGISPGKESTVFLGKSELGLRVLLLLAWAGLRSSVEDTRMERNTLCPSIPSA